MDIKKIIITNFKSIEGPLELDFERIKGFWKIGGAVGAGKTTIGESILFGLFGTIKGKNNTDLVSWGKKKGFIEVYCNSKGHDIYIKREFRLQGQSELYVTIDGDEITFTNKRDAQGQLEREYYDVSRMTLELLCIISFNNFKSLATLNTADSKAFLDQVFGFYVLSNYGNICKEISSEVNADIIKTNNNISSITSQINKIKQLSQIEKIEGDIEALKSENIELSKLCDECNNKRTDIDKEYQSQSSKLTKDIGEIIALGKAKAKEIQFIEQGVCPTCGAPIDQSQLELKKREKDVLTQTYKEKNEQLKSLKSEYDTNNSTLWAEYNKHNTKRTENISLIAKLEEQEKRLNINTKEIDELNIQLEEQQKTLDSQEQEVQEWKTLYNILTNDIRQKILSSFIPLLNQSILFYTKQLQIPYVITFDENFKCGIRLVGIGREVPISNLSTGQLKTVDISIILGVLRTIMNNINFNVNFLDELISNMDFDLRETICKVLKSNLKPNQTIFIISHVEMDEKYFDGIIEANLEYKDSLPYSTYNFSK